MGVEKATQTLRAKNAFKCSAKSAKYSAKHTGKYIQKYHMQLVS